VTGWPREWWKGPLYAFDKESTGTDTRIARTVQWCVALTAPGCAPQVMSGIVNPGVPIPAGATEVHGITDEYAQRYGAAPADALEQCASELAGAINARIPVTGQNLAYDWALLHWECIRHGVPTVLERTGGVIMPVIDLLVLDKLVVPRRAGKGARKLSALAPRYGVRLEGAHDAIADCLAATECIRVLASRFPEVGNMGPKLLHAMQQEWRAEQCSNLQAYFRTEAKPRRPDAYVDPCWPLCLDLNHPTT
jgi:DNA polymerase-3 subunit epsilon